MSIVQKSTGEDGRVQFNIMQVDLLNGVDKDKLEASDYSPTEEEKRARAMMLQHFTLGYTTMYTPRVELNDLCVVDRMTVDQQAWNTYQPNNGEPEIGDEVNAWRSRAMRPILRNKVISMAAHATARLIFPRVIALNPNNEHDVDLAQVMQDLLEWTEEQSEYGEYAVRRVISALTDPASIGYTEYAESYRTVKYANEFGSYDQRNILDEDNSGFINIPVPVDELYIENFYEPDIQKQAFLIWRRVISYSQAEAKYGTLPNWIHVKPGVMTLYNDANATFYQKYDPQLRGTDVEEVIYWNRRLDLKLITLNAVLVTPHDNPNQRADKQYPFDKFGYELINNRCFYYKSLAFNLLPEANIINTLYPMFIDGTYLNLYPPMVNIGGETITGDVIVPGAVTTLSDPNADLRAIKTSNDLKAGMDALQIVENSIAQSSQSNLAAGQEGAPGTPSTAYEISRLEQNSQTLLGLFITMIAKHVKDFGDLRMGDILQYTPIPEITEMEGNDLTFKSFYMPNPDSPKKGKKIAFKILPEMTAREHMSRALELLDKENKTGMTVYEVDPQLFREMKYQTYLTTDILHPKSKDLERAYDLETFDRLIQSPSADQEEALRLLLGTNPNTARNEDKYISKQPAQQMPPLGGPQASQALKQGTRPSPTAATGQAMSALPQGQLSTGTQALPIR